MTRHNCPYCTDRNGRSKRLYPSSEDAHEIAAHIFRERGVQLRVYRCDQTGGYHLTSKLTDGW